MLALVQLDELPELEADRRAHAEVVAQVVALIKRDSRSIDYVGHIRGVIALLMPATTARGAHARLERLAHLLASSNVTVAGKRMSMTPIIGYASLERGLAQSRSRKGLGRPCCTRPNSSTCTRARGVGRCRRRRKAALMHPGCVGP